MDKDTTHTRTLALLQRSRKAYRLYSSMSRVQEGENGAASALQLREWGDVNFKLSQSLSTAIESRSALSTVLVSVGELFYRNWRESQTELVRKQRELLRCVESTDFIRASRLATELIVLKARCQACQAAHHELDRLIGRTQGSDSATVKSENSLLDSDDFVRSLNNEIESEDQEEVLDFAKVLPFSPRR